MGEAKRRRKEGTEYYGAIYAGDDKFTPLPIKRRRKKAKPVDLPIADQGEITSTTIYPTIEAAFIEEITTKPWFMEYSAITRQMMKFVFVTGVAEMMRTVVFRAHTEDSGAVFDDLNREIEAYNAELHRQRAAYLQSNAELH